MKRTRSEAQMHSDQRSHVRHNFRRHAPGSLLSPWEQAHQYPKIQLSVQVEPQHPDRFLRCRTIQTIAGLQRKACSAILTADSTQLFFSTTSSHQEQGTEEQTGQVVEVSAGNGQHSCAQPPSGLVSSQIHQRDQQQKFENLAKESWNQGGLHRKGRTQQRYMIMRPTLFHSNKLMGPNTPSLANVSLRICNVYRCLKGNTRPRAPGNLDSHDGPDIGVQSFRTD